MHLLNKNFLVNLLEECEQGQTVNTIQEVLNYVSRGGKEERVVVFMVQY